MAARKTPPRLRQPLPRTGRPAPPRTNAGGKCKGVIRVRAAIYVRLSKEDDDVRKQGPGKPESESIRNQKALLLQYAADRGYAIYDIYSDEDYSGADRDRPAFNRLLRDAGEHRFDVVLAKSQSRFTRDMELVERYLHGKFMEWGIRFIALTDHADTDDAGNKKARQINGLVNEWYLEDLSANVRTVLTHKRRSGQYIGSFALYGYRKDPADHNRLVIDPEAAAVVRRIFAMALAGYGVPRIVQALNGAGIPSPTAYKQAQGLAYFQNNARSGGLWSPATVHAMLQNRTYTGDLVQGRHRKASYKSKKILQVPQKDWIIVPGTHEPIIGKEAFERVRQMRGGRARPCAASGMVRPLAGKVFCGCCGSAMESYRNGRRRPYLRCRLHARCPSRCQNRSIAAEDLDALVLARLRQHLDALFNLQAVDLSGAAAQAERDRARQEAGLEHLRQEYARRCQALRMLCRDKSLGLLDDALFRQLEQSYREENGRLQQRIGALERELAFLPQGGQARLERLRQEARQLGRPAALTRDLACSLIESVRIGPPAAPGSPRDVEIRWLF